MNFGTFIGLVFLVVLWHVCGLVKEMICAVLKDDIRTGYFQKRRAERNQVQDEQAGSSGSEKRTIGFQSTEVTALNDKEES